MHLFLLYVMKAQEGVFYMNLLTYSTLAPLFQYNNIIYMYNCKEPDLAYIIFTIIANDWTAHAVINTDSSTTQIHQTTNILYFSYVPESRLWHFISCKLS